MLNNVRRITKQRNSVRLNMMHITFEVELAGPVAGVNVVCGTDAGIGPIKPHGILPHAGEMLVHTVGFNPMDALRSMTSRAA
jgi:hypothetical protein